MNNNQQSNHYLFEIPLSFFFFNKPKTFYVYIFCILMILFSNLIIDGFGTYISFPLSWLAFSLIYKISLYWIFFVRDIDPNLSIKNIKISSVDVYFKNYFISIAVFFIISSILICFFPMYVMGGTIYRSADASIFRISYQYNFLFLVLTIISSLILQKFIISKFITEAIKNNVDISNTNIDTLYGELRTILTKKLIDTDQN